jgi:integrase
MHLVWASEKFAIMTRPKPGFPILLHEEGKSCEPANSFMRYYLSRGSIGSTKSWPATGRAMYDFFSYLEANGLDWQDVDRDDERTLVAGYREYSLNDVQLSDGTVAQRLSYICAFYEYALEQQWIQRLPFSYETRRTGHGSGGFLAHTGASGGEVSVRDVMNKRHQKLPKFLSQAQAQTLMTAATNPHHKLIIRFGLQTGLRREEIATFPTAYVFDPDKAGRPERNLRITLDPSDGTGMKTKGSKQRDIFIGRRLMKDLYQYLAVVRGERRCPNEPDPKPLFINQDGQPYAADGKGIEGIVRNIGKKVGIQTHPHMLRHTYATHTLVALLAHRERNRIEPLAFVQRQLGHASLQTTMVYLHLVNELADDAVLQYDDELNDYADAEAL